MDAKQFEDLSQKLNTIILLLSMDKLQDKSKKESILLLNKMGLDNSTIASIVQTTPDVVSVRLSEAKKAEAKKSGAKKSKVKKVEDEQPQGEIS